MISDRFAVGEFVGTIVRRTAPTSMLLIALAGASCDAAVPPVQRASPVNDVPMISVLNDPQKFNAVRLRLRGICRIEFEGNALYLSRQSFNDRHAEQAIWLNLGWPVKPDVQRLDGQEVIIEGTFDGAGKGHWGAFAGSLKDIQALKVVER